MTILPRLFFYFVLWPKKKKNEKVFTGISDCCKKHSTIYLFKYEKTSEKYRIGIVTDTYIICTIEQQANYSDHNASS